MGRLSVWRQSPCAANSNPLPDVYDIVNSRRRTVQAGRALALCLLLGAALLCALISGCPGPRRKPAAKPPPKQSAAKSQKKPEPQTALKAEFGKARILWSEKTGARLMDAQFKEALASQAGKNAALELKGVRASLYQNGKAASTIVAPRVVADSKTKEVRASGGVRVISGMDGGTAVAGRIVWKAGEDKVYGTGGVKVQKGNISITARSFEADTSLRKAHFTDAQLGMD